MRALWKGRACCGRHAVWTAALALVLAGCASQPRLPFRYDAEGKPVQEKRIERYAQRDFYHHFSRKAYEPMTPPPYGFKGDCQTVYEQWGLPDYQRKAFRSLNGEKVDEWLYLDELRMFQFIDSMMVYDGPVTDYEQILLRRGYPNRADVEVTDTGTRVDSLVYDGIFSPVMEDYHFHNGRLIQSQEGR